MLWCVLQWWRNTTRPLWASPAAVRLEPVSTLGIRAHELLFVASMIGCAAVPALQVLHINTQPTSSQCRSDMRRIEWSRLTVPQPCICRWRVLGAVRLRVDQWCDAVAAGALWVGPCGVPGACRQQHRPAARWRLRDKRCGAQMQRTCALDGAGRFRTACAVAVW